MPVSEHYQGQIVDSADDGRWRGRVEGIERFKWRYSVGVIEERKDQPSRKRNENQT